MLIYESFGFQRTKMLQLSDTANSGFSVEAADNLSNSLIESTAFLKKKFFKNICRNRVQSEDSQLVSSKAGHSIDPNESCNPNVQLFLLYQRSVSPPFREAPHPTCNACFSVRFIWARRVIVAINFNRTTRKSNYFQLPEKEQFHRRSFCDSPFSGSPQMRQIVREQGDG